MALTPIDEIHALQIQAGTLGRRAGHAFEDEITKQIDSLTYPLKTEKLPGKHVFKGNPALNLLNYIGRYYQKNHIKSATAISTGALATSEEGRKWLSINGSNVTRCKSDIVLTVDFGEKDQRTIGISTKQCSNATPTNAQLYFTTARGFVKLLRDNGITVSDEAVIALRQFCGDTGFRPVDNLAVARGRKVDPRRFFWEELNKDAKSEWEKIFSVKQDEVTRLLLQKAYIEDKLTPDFLIHKTRAATSWNETEVALYFIDELVDLSARYQGFATRAYTVRKGSYKDPAGVTHLAPRFGVVQMQRGGQQQHPEQLQFNLEAGYFYRLDEL